MPKKLIIWTAFFAFVLLISVLMRPAWAESENILYLDPSQGRHNLNPYLEYMEDPTCDLTISDVSAPGYEEHFIPHTDSKAPSFAYTDSAIWLRFQVQPSYEHEDSQQLLRLGYPLLNRVDFFIPDETGGYIHKESGNSFPFHQRELEHRDFVFSLPSSWDEEQPFFLRVKTQSTLVTPLTLWNTESFLAHAEVEYFSLGIYYGILLIMVLYTLFLFIYIRAQDYLYYAFYIASVGIFNFTFNGLSFQFLWPSSSWWAQHSINVFIFTGCFSAVLFARKVLPIKLYAPRLDKIMVLLAAFAACLIPLSLVLNFTLAMNLAILTVLFCAAFIIPSTIICLYNNFRPARYLLLGWSFLGIGVVLISGRSLGIFPDTFLTMYGTQIGFTAKVIFLFLGLADHMHILRKEKDLMENKNRILEKEKQNLLHAETLNALTQEVSVSDEVRSIAKKLLIYINKLVPYNYASFLTLKDNKFHFLAFNSTNPRMKKGEIGGGTVYRRSFQLGASNR